MENWSLQTTRLILRPFQLSDASEVQKMAGDPLVAATTLTIPHPYLDGAAEAWIGQHEDWRIRGVAYPYAIEEKTSKQLVGCVSMDVSQDHLRAMLGYWVGKEFWNKGYCTEATKRLIQFAFEDLNLRKVCAYHMATNEASGKVMKNAGMKQEGYFHKHVVKKGESLDCVYYGIVRE